MGGGGLKRGQGDWSGHCWGVQMTGDRGWECGGENWRESCGGGAGGTGGGGRKGSRGDVAGNGVFVLSLRWPALSCAQRGFSVFAGWVD